MEDAQEVKRLRGDDKLVPFFEVNDEYEQIMKYEFFKDLFIEIGENGEWISKVDNRKILPIVRKTIENNKNIFNIFNSCGKNFDFISEEFQFKYIIENNSADSKYWSNENYFRTSNEMGWKPLNTQGLFSHCSIRVSKEYNSTQYILEGINDQSFSPFFTTLKHCKKTKLFTLKDGVWKRDYVDISQLKENVRYLGNFNKLKVKVSLNRNSERVGYLYGVVVAMFELPEMF